MLALYFAILLAGIPLALFIPRIPDRLRGPALMVPALVVFLMLLFGPGLSVFAGEPVQERYAWVPQLNLDIAFYLSGPGLMLGLLVTGIGALILLYAAGYMHGDSQAHRLYAVLYLFLLAMFGLAVADHLIVFFIFWEMTSVSSYLLIGYKSEKAIVRRHALQALLITAAGGMALLAGFILLASITGNWYLSELSGYREVILASPLGVWAFCLMALGALTKSAQFPFHFWLPNAMAAPTPISAYLHSATMVKAGIFLLLLLVPVYSGTAYWQWILCLSGGITFLLGTLRGWGSDDLKAILAGTTLAVLGLLTLLLGMGTEKALLACVLLFIGHALYKAPLFMVAGIIDHATGTRDVKLLSGLAPALPFSALAAGLAAFSMMGIPPFFGFLGKEYFYKAALSSGTTPVIIVLGVFVNALMFGLAYRAGLLPFFKRSKASENSEPLHSVGVGMQIGPIILSLAGLAFACLPFLSQPLVTSVVESLKPDAYSTFKLWSGFNLPLLLSGVTLFLGLIFLYLKDYLILVVRKIASWLSADDLYDKGLDGILGFSSWQTRFIQSGNLRYYLLTILLFTCALVGFKLMRYPEFPVGNATPFSWAVLWTSILMMLATGAAVFAKSRLSAMIALGIVGFGVALLFAQYGAPDLAITQILIETLTMVFFAWVVAQLPALRRFSSRKSIIFDVAVSSLVGIGVVFLLLKSKAVDLAPRISSQLVEWSYPQAHGNNVVNVILVDFRALDTMGEVFVLGIAALGVWTLLRSLVPHSNFEGKFEISPYYRVASRYLFWIIFVLSLIVLYRGHNLPGGGFIGGLLAASAVLVLVVGKGWSCISELTGWRPVGLICTGLGITIASGVPALLVGETFMKGLWLPFFDLPLLGKIKLGTPLLFDVGVYLAVTGFVLKCAAEFGRKESA